jgi:hypothetical protein
LQTLNSSAARNRRAFFVLQGPMSFLRSSRADGWNSICGRRQLCSMPLIGASASLLPVDSPDLNWAK